TPCLTSGSDATAGDATARLQGACRTKIIRLRSAQSVSEVRSGWSQRKPLIRSRRSFPPASPLKDHTMSPAPADDRLREETRLLGGLLGDVIRTEGGQALYDRIEAVRQASVHYHRDPASKD